MSAAADPYTRCLDCGFIASAESMDYTLTAAGGVDRDRPRPRDLPVLPGQPTTSAPVTCCQPTGR